MPSRLKRHACLRTISPRSVEVLAVAERAAVLSGEQAGERGLAVEQRGAGEIAAVEMQQVEQVVVEAVAAALAQVGLQGGEVRGAASSSTTTSPSRKAVLDGQSLERLLHGARNLRSSRARCGS